MKENNPVIYQNVTTKNIDKDINEIKIRVILNEILSILIEIRELLNKNKYDMSIYV